MTQANDTFNQPTDNRTQTNTLVKTNSDTMNNHSDTTDTSTDSVSTTQTKADKQDKNSKPEFPRFINTFMKRRTHMNKQAEQALNDPKFARYLVNDNDADISAITDLRALFADTEQTPNGSDAPLTLEIGFGMGSSLIEMAIADPTRNFVGIEVHEPGIGKCAYMANEHNLTNIKIINGDAIKLLTQLPENHIDRIQLYFPDPWQKKRHHKRRFVSPERMKIVTRSLKSGGWFHTATDWEHYAFRMLDVLDNFAGLQNQAGKGNFTPRPDFRPMTKFENRGIDRGHGVWDLIYIKE